MLEFRGVDSRREGLGIMVWTINHSQQLGVSPCVPAELRWPPPSRFPPLLLLLLHTPPVGCVPVSPGPTDTEPALRPPQQPELKAPPTAQLLWHIILCTCACAWMPSPKSLHCTHGLS